MQSLEKFFGLRGDDFRMLAPNLKNAATQTIQKYLRDTESRFRMIDSFALLCLSLFAIQIVYGVALCRDPFNSFIAGTFCSLGMFGMTMGLRIQLSFHET
jgi:hypothetical protein